MAALRVPERKILIKIKGFRQGPELILYPWWTGFLRLLLPQLEKCLVDLVFLHGDTKILQTHVNVVYTQGKWWIFPACNDIRRGDDCLQSTCLKYIFSCTVTWDDVQLWPDLLRLVDYCPKIHWMSYVLVGTFLHYGMHSFILDPNSTWSKCIAQNCPIREDINETNPNKGNPLQPRRKITRPSKLTNI
jgi:hypothetical protein